MGAAHHPSDRDLLLFADQELDPGRTVRVRRHVEGCMVCGTRLHALRSALVCAADSLPHQAMALPPAAPARARLVLRLEQLARQRHAARPGVRQWALACATVLALVTGGAWLLRGTTGPVAAERADGGLRVFLLPDAALTPGLARSVTVADVCGEKRYGRTQPVSASVHAGVFARYGADSDRSSEYELDYLITPELGGVADARNLWPQPFTGTVWNAYVKDELELHLHRLVCDGGMDFATAQRELATDWIAAYKRRFDSDTPLRDYATAPVTERDTDFLRAELEELGVAAPALRADGATLMTLWQLARQEKVIPSP